jgi:anti-anti-sigma factor
MHDDAFPVEWTGRQAVITFPGRVDISNADQLRDRLLAVTNRGAAVLIADMTGTASCDHAGVEAIARACQRAAISGTQVRLVVTAPGVRRVLTIEGLDRLVPIYPSLEAATETRRGPGWPGDDSAAVSAATARSVTPAVLWQLIDALGDGLLLVAHDGKIVLVNRRCAEMFGYPREELTGLPVDALVPSDVRGAHQDYRAGYHLEPELRPMAERARLVALRKDGATLPVEITLSPVPTASETFILAVIRNAAGPGRRSDLLDLAQGTVADEPRVIRDLLDRVVQRLFQVGLSVQAASSLPADVARKRLAEALDQLDDAILQIRNYAFERSAPLGTGWSASLAATWARKSLMVAAATRCSMARSSAWPSAPSGGR